MAFKFNPFTGNFDEVTDASAFVAGPGSSTDNAIVRWDGTTGALVQNSSVTIDDSGNLVVSGDLTVNGTTTTVNSATLDVTDTNITVNNTGNDASSEGAGLTVERTGTDGSFVYEDALASKWKLGALGSEVEVADVSSTQTLTNKTIDADLNTITDIANANIATSAAIVFSKMEALTASRATVTNGSGFVSVSATTATELGYLSGVTSALQTQLDAKLDDIGTSTDNALVRWDGVAGEAVQNSLVALDDAGAMTGLTGLTFSTGVQAVSILDEDDMVSDSATALVTQQSVKAYVDSSVAGGVFSVNSVAINTSAAANQTYLVDVSGGAVQVTLPTPGVNVFVRIKDSTGSANTNNITVARNGSENIDGIAASYILDSNLESKVFVSDGTNWFVF
jgi:hypothetical protein